MAEFQYQQPQRFRITNRQRDEEKKRKSGSGGGIPDRWLDYLGVNSWVENTRFIAFKCPLKPEMQKHLNDDRRFTLGDLVERLDDCGKELGLLIDLTNTDRYYKSTDITDAQIEYYKLMTPGHNQIPSEKCYQEFLEVVRKFLNKNKNNDKLIGVHCTHGLNRTGYLIVRYMIEQMDIDPTEALEAFNRARGHSMEKYTEDLLKRTSISNKSQTSSIPNESSTILPNNDITGDQIQWPELYTEMEKISLNDHGTRQQRNQQVLSSLSMHNTSNQSDEQVRLSNSPRITSRGRASYCRQTTVTPRILNSSYSHEQTSNQTTAAYFGSGSSVGRGRPMTGDR